MILSAAGQEVPTELNGWREAAQRRVPAAPAGSKSARFSAPEPNTRTTRTIALGASLAI
jgi:hypothetical protein